MATVDDDSGMLSIFESDAIYYNAATEKWESGTFTLTRNHIQFTHSMEGSDQFHLCLPLGTVTEIEKRQYGFFKPALVVTVGSEKHWFGSFNSRDAVYNMLELFWREALISKPCKSLLPSKKVLSNSSLGKELVSLLNEAESTLAETANSLAEQGRQLEETEEDVESLNDDLDKAKELMDSLSSPFSLTFSLQKSDSSEDSPHRLQKYRVTFSFSNSADRVDWEKGTLIISTDLILLKVEEKKIMQVTKDELESFEVLSPWELCISHTFSGRKTSCFFMCPQLSRLLKFVSSIPHYKSKITYHDDDDSLDSALCSSHSSPNGSTRSSPTSPESGISKKSSNVSETDLITLTDEEIEDINCKLLNLQTVALKVKSEQENQLEKISALTENMEKAEMKMKNVAKSSKKES